MKRTFGGSKLYAVSRNIPEIGGQYKGPSIVSSKHRPGMVDVSPTLEHIVAALALDDDAIAAISGLACLTTGC
jgi:hypothetical protein